jgi:hypothetical protein
VTTETLHGEDETAGYNRERRRTSWDLMEGCQVRISLDNLDILFVTEGRTSEC